MPEEYPKILVIVVLYNGAKWLDKCCSSIKASTVPLESCFIDNASIDNSVDIVQRHFPDAFIHKCEKNIGFGQANNVGFRHALKNNADYVFLLNQDAYIAPDMMEKLLAAIPSMEQPGIISPIHLNGDGTKLDYQFRDCLYYTMCPGFLEDATRQKLKPCYLTYMGYAAAWLLPLETLKTIGGFDPIFFHYGEDVHYVSRVLYHGLKIYNVPEAFVRHDRLYVGNESAYRHNLIIRGFMNTYLDVNRKGSWWFSKRQLIPLRDLFVAFLSFKWEQFWKIITAYFHIVINQAVLRKNILVNQQVGSNWL